MKSHNTYARTSSDVHYQVESVSEACNAFQENKSGISDQTLLFRVDNTHLKLTSFTKQWQVSPLCLNISGGVLWNFGYEIVQVIKRINEQLRLQTIWTTNQKQQQQQQPLLAKKIIIKISKAYNNYKAYCFII